MKGKINWEERYPYKTLEELNEFERQNAIFLKEMFRKKNKKKKDKDKIEKTDDDCKEKDDYMKYFVDKGDEWLENHCFVCKEHRSTKGKLFRCSGCTSNRKYCSVECQRKDWKTHK